MPKVPSHFNLTKEGYYKTTYDWAYDIYHSQTLWLRRALLVIFALMFLLALSLLLNLLLFPLKEKVPYLYAFDHATGEVTKIGVLEPTTLSSKWEITRYLLIQYVIHHESYNYDNIDIPYQMVWAQSVDQVRKQYEDFVNSSNPMSPYAMYGKDKYITVRVLSLNRLNDNTIDVKFEKQLHDRVSNTIQVTQKEAIIKWTFVQAETSQKMLDRDPLGFKVTYFQDSQVNLDK